MKFLSFLLNNQTLLGLLSDSDKVINLSRLFDEDKTHGFSQTPTNVSELIKLGESALTFIQNKVAHDIDKYPLLELSSLEILPPLNLTKNVFCVGRNYRDHIIEGNIARGVPAETFPKAIEFFTKPPTTITAHGAEIPRYASLTDNLDYEAELAIVIAKRGKNIPAEEALDYVFGYTIINDITARNLQQKHGQWFKGKGLDSTCPMGPVITHSSAIVDANNLNITLKVNNELRQEDSTSGMIFKIQDVIEQLSVGMTLEPGDIIATGTPKGVGFAMKPPACLEVGDVIEATIEGIGTLRNTIVD